MENTETHAIQKKITIMKSFLNQFEERCKDMHMQKYFHDIENSGRCCIYNEIKQSYKMKSYLKCNIRSTIRLSLRGSDCLFIPFL